MKIPAKLGAVADLLYKTKQKRLALQKQVEELEQQERDLREHIIKELPKSEASGVAGSVARVTVQNKEVLQVEDWSSFYAYVHKHKAYELLQKRLSNGAIEERVAEGEKIPGVKKFLTPTVSINKV